MKLNYYGTGAAEGVPALFCDCEICKRSASAGGRNLRTRSQALVDDAILLDFPPDTFAHILYGGLPLKDINACLITHSHHDHLYPDDFGMTASAYSSARAKPLTVYAAEDVCALISDSLNTYHALEEGRIVIAPVTPFSPFTVEGHTITPLKARHKNSAGAVIYAIEAGEKRLLYAHDTGWLHDETWEYLKASPTFFDCVSFDCTAVLKSPDNHAMKSHMNLPTVENVRRKLIELGCLDETSLCILNHLSHNGGMTYDDLEAYLRGSPYIVSFDGMEIVF